VVSLAARDEDALPGGGLSVLSDRCHFTPMTWCRIEESCLKSSRDHSAARGRFVTYNALSAWLPVAPPGDGLLKLGRNALLGALARTNVL
jgi:hypothetical protein